VFLGHAAATLTKFKVPESEQRDLVAFVQSLKKDYRRIRAKSCRLFDALEFLASTGEKAPAGLTVVIAWLWLTVAWSATYWILFFATGVVQTSSDTAYLDFERAFPVADAWLAFASAGCAINCARRRPQAVLWALVASGASVYLGCMDTLYNLEHGKYASLDAGMILEMLINLSSFASPAILIPYFWRNRRWFGG
jgi:hypothetical protein